MSTATDGPVLVTVTCPSSKILPTDSDVTVLSEKDRDRYSGREQSGSIPKLMQSSFPGSVMGERQAVTSHALSLDCALMTVLVLYIIKTFSLKQVCFSL